jgi:hypothetical protein
LVRTVGVSTAGCETTAIVEADVLRTALSTLPDDVQALLWRTEVDDECLADTSDRGGTSAHNVAVHRHRAWRALGTAYLAQHAEPDGGLIGLDADCKTTVCGESVRQLGV